MTQLELRDFALVGFSMGGGEVARYLGKYGSKGVSKAVFISAVPPFLLKTPDNPEGVDGSVFEGIQKAVAADRYAFFTEFFKNFYNTDLLLGKRVSEQAVQASWNVAAGASATASLACVPTWHEDFRKDLARIDVPTLVIHGDADRILPITASGLRTAKLIKGARSVVVKDGPHCITWTHADEVNRELVNFLGVAKHAASASRRKQLRSCDFSAATNGLPSETGTPTRGPKSFSSPVTRRLGVHLPRLEPDRGGVGPGKAQSQGIFCEGSLIGSAGRRRCV